MAAILCTQGWGAHERSALAGAGAALVASGATVVSASAESHEALQDADVAHRHVLRGAEDDLLRGAEVVVASLDAGEPLSSNDQQAAAALIRAAALGGLVVVVSSDHLPLLRHGAAGVAQGRRKQLAAHALRYLAAHDAIFAREELASPAAVSEGGEGATVVVLGGGGREHALAEALARSPQVARVLVAPGNGATARMGDQGVSNVSDVRPDDPQAVVGLAQRERAALVVVGPEAPLVAGVTDALAAAGVPCFGPSQLAARLEGSKAFCKDFLARHGIPTARYENFRDHAAALAHLEAVDYPVVIKASGLAAGKGVVLPESKEEAREELRRMMVDSVFGEAGAEVVIEERLQGEEVSVLAFADGQSVALMPGAQDHKRALDGDKGLNTGGMGAYAPAPALTPALRASLALDVVQRTIDGARAEGFPFVGVLFAGIIITARGPQVLEFNCRFGDPETQVLMPLLESDLFDTMMRCTRGELLGRPVRFAPDSCATVVLAAKGYPASYDKGAEVTLNPPEGVRVYQAGTSVGDDNDAVRTSGGRVLAVTARRPELAAALEAIYAALDARQVHFEGAHFRRDIGQRALAKPLRIGVLGSTRGTDLQYVIDAVDQGWLRAELTVVVSNKKDAYILERAKLHGIPTVLHSMKGCKDRAEFDAQVTATLREREVDLVLLIGYMRILSDGFVDEWYGRVFNVHPSLLPDFAGGMDLNVHQAVIDAGRSESGCTIHLVTREVDGGPILVQKRCPVLPEDDADALKARVQALEGVAFVEAIHDYAAGKRVE